MARENKKLAWRFGKMAASMEPYYHQLDFRKFDDFGDEAFAYLVKNVKGVDMLDLNETEITNDSIELMTRMEYVKELRIKGCRQVNDDAIVFINKINGLEFLHAKGTGITINGLLRLSPDDTLKEILFSHESGEDIAEKMAMLLKKMPGCQFVVNGNPY